jgi:hypothetical protein
MGKRLKQEMRESLLHTLKRFEEARDHGYGGFVSAIDNSQLEGFSRITSIAGALEKDDLLIRYRVAADVSGTILKAQEAYLALMDALATLPDPANRQNSLFEAAWRTGAMLNKADAYIGNDEFIRALEARFETYFAACLEADPEQARETICNLSASANYPKRGHEKSFSDKAIQAVEAIKDPFKRFSAAIGFAKDICIAQGIGYDEHTAHNHMQNVMLNSFKDMLVADPFAAADKLGRVLVPGAILRKVPARHWSDWSAAFRNFGQKADRVTLNTLYMLRNRLEGEEGAKVRETIIKTRISAVATPVLAR